jgi:succinate dehydrogenase / fumarate reductase, cytochrome b subunit
MTTSTPNPAGLLAIRDTTLGKKFIMAASGVVLLGFSVVHMLGNMQIFVGRETINGYHVLLYGLPTLLWGARLVLVGAAVAHVVSAAQLTLMNRAARPQRYARSDRIATSYAARTMIVSGVFLLFYLCHHVAHMTVGVTAGLGYAHDHVDVYSNLVRSYQHAWMAIASIGAALVFGAHIHHGAWSLFQSLGFQSKRIRGALVGLALGITAGYVSVPLAVLTGLVG